jgi:hypothetical protein
MPGESDVSLGNEQLDTMLYFPSVTFPTLGSSASSTTTLSVPGVLPGDYLSMTMQTPPAHIFLENAYVSSNGVVTISWTTDTSGVSTSTVAVLGEVCRPNRPYTSLPSALV